jgi:hypothetical protein
MRFLRTNTKTRDLLESTASMAGTLPIGKHDALHRHRSAIQSLLAFFYLFCWKRIRSD